MTVEYLDAKRIQGNYLVGDKAWSFNGGKVTCSFQLLPVGTSDWSISMWIKFNNFTDSDELVREETSNFELWRNSDGMKVVHDSGNVTFVAQASLATDTWYHIVLTNDDGSFKVYWNGDEITSASGTTRTIGTVTTWYLGGRSNDSEAFHGVMDQFLVYTSVLDQTAIDLLYNDGKADRTPSTTNLQTYYNFEQTGTTLEDQAGSNDGSAGGTITTDVDGAISAQDDKATLIIDATSFTTPSFNQYLDYSSYDARPHDVQLKSDGTKMYVMNYQEKEIEQFSLSPAYDISTASSDGTYDVSTYDPSPVGLFIDSSGSHLFVAGRNQNNIDQFSLGTAWDITTGVSHVRTNSTAWGNIWGLTFNPDGTKMYVMDSGEVEQYDLGSAWNITTLSNNETFDPDTQDNNAFDAEWNDDGTALYITGHENDSIYKYTCSTAYSVASSSISFDSVYFAFPTDYHDSSGFCFAKSGQKMYVSTGEATYDRILEYDIGSPISSDLPENTLFEETDVKTFANSQSNAGIETYWLQDNEWKKGYDTLVLDHSSSTGNQNSLDDRTALGEKILSGNSLIGKKVKSIKVKLKVGAGSPAGDIVMNVVNNASGGSYGTVKHTFGTALGASAVLTSSYVEYEFVASSPYTVVANDCFNVQLTSGTETDNHSGSIYILMDCKDTSQSNADLVRFQDSGGWSTETAKSCYMKFYGSAT